METFKKNWITYLGIFFIFLAFLYFLKLAIDEAWVPPVARVAIGLVLGVTGVFWGYTSYRKNNSKISQIIAGMGLAITYATFGYAGFSREILWSTNTLLIALVATNAFATYLGSKFNMRILIFLSVFGGLLTPMVIRAEESQVWVLFFYTLALNIVAIYLSAVKDWKELRIMSFLITLLIYISYYFLFDPENWEQPIFYLTTFFITYLAALILASWYDQRNFEGVNLYLNLINGINFVFWSIFILDNFELAYAFPALFTGFLFIAAAVVIYYLSQRSYKASGVYFLLGIIVIAIATGDLGLHFASNGLHYVITTSVWLFLIAFVFGSAQFIENRVAKKLAIAAWIVLFVYWFAHAWDVEWVRWFGLPYIPFINPGALVWIAMAVCGFIFSKLIENDAQAHEEKLEKERLHKLSIFLAIASHVVVGGLLTIQMQNTWRAYDVTFMRIDLVLSIMWMLYALIIFLWGAYSRAKIFRVIGSAVILITTAKVLLLDLAGAKALHKVLFLLIIGLLTLAIAYINNKWAEGSPESKDDLVEIP
ncbi:DUF2339 domain-containing protein [Fulvivirgaceae bacterium BMA10]|uniref:DUF2339 domain-containing protein n=1 Tax=Splendidivirga corallicola TaxID=3051826 RepID=A0ABT8KGC6_9BACT|nr:DUF2339 domain-containing protein [Fulvivirgaceae bacterium BMA10]